MLGFSGGYDPDTEKDRLKSRAGRAMPGGLAQLMVVINGLLLTLTAYVTFSILVQEIVQDRMTEITEAANIYVSDQFADVERSFYTLGVMATALDMENLEEFKADIHHAAFDLKAFDLVYVLYKNELDAWDIVPVVRKAGIETTYDSFVLQPSAALANYVQSHAPETRRQIKSLADFKGALSVRDDAGVISKPLALIQQTYLQDGQTAYVIGYFQIRHTMNSWIERSEDITALNIMYADNFVTLPIYKYMTEGKDGKVLDSFFDVALAENTLSVDVKAIVSEDTAFLQSVPLLLLVFGLALTAIGTLYVRNNRTQSLRLAKMNKVLAQKNYDLNTQIKQREELGSSLEKAERDNRAIINAVSDVIFETDREGVINFVNDRWYQIMQVPKEQVIGKNFFDFLHPQDRSEQEKNFKEIIGERKKSFRSITRLLQKNDEYRSVDLSASLLEDGKKIVGTITDIEERRRAETALKEAEQKYRAIVENVAGGIYQIDKDGRFLSANPAMARILGYNSPQELLSTVRNANQELYDDIRGRIRYLRQREDFGDSTPIEIEMIKSDGTKIWVSENTRAVFDQKGLLQFFEGSIADISERKEAEMKLRDAKIASDLASRAKSEFLTNMSHELRTPLNAIIGFSEIIKDEAFGPVGSPEYKDYASNIHDGGRRLLNIINEILDISRIDAGDRVLNESVTDLRKVAQSCIDLLQPKIEASELRVDLRIGAGFPKLIAEELAVKQMLMNLLSNAIKFTPNTGHIAIEAEIAGTGSVRLSVTDTGIGLDDAEIEKALSPFGQVEAHHSRSGAGTGLGLTLVKSLISMHQGTFELLSQKGIGTTATLIFPARRVAQSPAQKQDVFSEETAAALLNDIKEPNA